MSQPVCVIVGVGPGSGSAFARRFAAAGYRVGLLARSSSTIEALVQSLPGAMAYSCDVTEPDSVASAFTAINADLGVIDTLIFNAGSGVFRNFDDVTAEQFEQSWRVNALGSFLVAKAVTPSLRRAGRGNLIFVGATASRRGHIMTAAFAPAKAAQKSLVESLARHLGPAGIHVALLILDGVVATEGSRQMFAERADDFFMRPEDVAEAAYALARQPRSAWSSEVEVRPFAERW